MSGPLGNDEIEDVVSSVRRLVSPNARPRPTSRDLGADRLLLTPAFQVVGGSDSINRLLLTMPIIETTDDQTVRAVEGATDQDPAAGTPVLGLDAGPERPGSLALDDAVTGVAEPSEPSPLFGTDDKEGLTTFAAEEDWDGAFWSEPEPDLAELALSVEEAELVTPVDDARPDATGPDPVDEAAEVAALPAARSGGVVPFPGVVQAVPAGGGEPSGPAVNVAAASEVSADGAAEVAGQLDEDALMQMVRTLIREELQGALGERITQNVRKLVRAEINRALAARSLD
jgi:hypothetical protein